MKLATSIALMTAALLTTLAIAATADPKPDDAKLLQGSWEPATAELGGHPVPEAVLKTITLKLDNGRYVATVAGKPDKGNYTVDPASSPKGMTVTGTDGPNQNKTFPAIYEVDAITLRICYDLSGAQRPTEFKSTEGTKLYLVTYRHRAD